MSYTSQQAWNTGQDPAPPDSTRKGGVSYNNNAANLPGVTVRYLQRTGDAHILLPPESQAVPLQLKLTGSEGCASARVAIPGLAHSGRSCRRRPPARVTCRHKR
eukprot:1141801-Pelagomonas_calceolata.AAC.1